MDTQEQTYTLRRGRLMLGNRFITAALVLCGLAALLQGLGEFFSAVALLLALALSIAGVIITDRTRVCPKCRKRLGKDILRGGALSKNDGLRCPNCDTYILLK